MSIHKSVTFKVNMDQGLIFSSKSQRAFDIGEKVDFHFRRYSMS